ncbi:DUF4160 domain-containing protein [Thiocapsa sp.]|uniref:DUF4160 domain-containing protein n=1 Tax=Thiocapsa sp. TaxID=2024551 RepID=UPI002C0F9C22|nr:DUF4160 domain-containing protein [Thiocapsa sp.]HSO82860.1 DUF4160 domain-containing protein [Thiocapsa sp.]
MLHEALERSRDYFHALYAEHEALIDIRTLEVIGGRLPKRALALTIEWAVEHREELMEDWKLCQLKQLPKRIAPLE